MKKKVLMLMVIAAFGYSSCKKEELAIPQIKKETFNLSDKGISCRDCGTGGWD